MSDLKRIRRTLRTASNRVRCEINRITTYNAPTPEDAEKAYRAGERLVGLLAVIDPMLDIIDYAASGNENSHGGKVLEALVCMNAVYDNHDGVCLFPRADAGRDFLDSWADGYAQVADHFDCVNGVVRTDDGPTPAELIDGVAVSPPAQQRRVREEAARSPVLEVLQAARRQARVRSYADTQTLAELAAERQRESLTPQETVPAASFDSGWRH